MHNLDSVSDSESYDSYSETSDMGDRLSRLEGIIKLISNTTEEGLAITLESYPFYSMLVESRRTDDTASAADAAVHTIVRGGFHFASRDMARRKQYLVGRTSPWWVRGRQKSPRKNALRVTDGQKQDISDRQSKEASPFTYEQKQDNSDGPVKEAPLITYEHEIDISKLVNSLPEREMEIAFNIVREGIPRSPDVVDQKLGVELDRFPNELLHSLLRFARVHESHIKEIMPARPASAADSAALVAPLPTLTRSETA